MSWKRRYDFAITRSFPAGNFQLTVFAFLARFGSQKIEKYRSLLRRRQLAAAAGDVILRMGTLATVALRTPHITHTHTRLLLTPINMLYDAASYFDSLFHLQLEPYRREQTQWAKKQTVQTTHDDQPEEDWCKSSCLVAKMYFFKTSFSFSLS